MDRYALKSSNLVSVGWEPDEEDSTTGTLEVEFKKGLVYAYDRVPEWVYQALLFAPSPGRYFLSNVAEQYDGERTS